MNNLSLKASDPSFEIYLCYDFNKILMKTSNGIKWGLIFGVGIGAYNDRNNLV